MPHRPVHPLQLVWDKINRGTEHLEELDRQIRPYLARNPYGTRQEFDKERDGYVGYLVVHEEPDRKWGIIAGEAVAQFRSALDYLVYQLSLLKRPDPPGSAFPIYLDRDAYFERQRCRQCGVRSRLSARNSYLRYIAPKYRTIIDGLQPYNRGEFPERALLAGLSKFSNQDKHRVAPVTFGRPIHVKILPLQEGAKIIALDDPKPFGSFYDGTAIYAYTATPNPHVPVQVEITLAVTFGELPVGMRELKAFGRKAGEIADLFETEVPEFRPWA
jgi:hypothetical protein